MAQAIPLVVGIVSAAATVASAISGMASAKEEKKAAAELAQQQREEARRRAEDEKKEQQRLLALQRARYGKAGLAWEGSPLLVQAESLAESEEQLRRIYENAERKAQAMEESGAQALRSGYVGAAGTLAKGFGQVYSLGRENKWW